jgi:hypothetical protein
MKKILLLLADGFEIYEAYNICIFIECYFLLLRKKRSSFFKDRD